MTATLLCLAAGLALAAAARFMGKCCCTPPYPDCARIVLVDFCVGRGGGRRVLKDGVPVAWGPSVQYPGYWGGTFMQTTVYVPAGTYTWEVDSPSACIEAESGTIEVTCGGPGGVATHYVTVPVTPTAGYVVVGSGSSCCCGVGPASIAMTSSKPLSNDRIFQDATFTYGPIPTSLLPLGLAPMGYLSTTQFVDTSTEDSFWYYLACFGNTYWALTRLYETSVYGSPYSDVLRYSWLPGDTCDVDGIYPSFGENTCCPFYMGCGSIFVGGDSSCVVTLTGGA